MIEKADRSQLMTAIEPDSDDPACPLFCRFRGGDQTIVRQAQIDAVDPNATSCDIRRGIVSGFINPA